MIIDEPGFRAALHPLLSFSNRLEALRLETEANGNWQRFGFIGKGYFQRIRELNLEIQDYLKTCPDEEFALPSEEMATAA